MLTRLSRLARSRRRLVAIVGGGLALLLVIAGLWTVTRPGSTPSASPSVPANGILAEEFLLNPTDLAPVRANTAWAVKETVNRISTAAPQPACFLQQAEGQPAPDNAATRTLEATAPEASPAAVPGGAAAVLHLLEAYSDENRAKNAYDLRKGQLGTCARTTAFITAGFTITEAGNDAAAVTLILQEPAAEHHTIILTRTGKVVSIVDETQTDSPLPVAGLMNAVTESLERLCSAAAGTCPGTPKVSPAPPPRAGIPGWLAAADLPRITPGSGTWSGTEPSGELKLVGSQCEAVDLNNPAGATAKQQRTYLLSGDNAAPSGFGLDEAVYTFASPEAAAAFGQQILDNVAKCSARTPTATVTGTPGPGGTGEGGIPITGGAMRISQKVSDVKSLSYRIAVTIVGNKVVYLLANPSGTFDFTDPIWQIVAQRAGERVSQSA